MNAIIDSKPPANGIAPIKTTIMTMMKTTSDVYLVCTSLLFKSNKQVVMFDFLIDDLFSIAAFLMSIDKLKPVNVTKIIPIISGKYPGPGVPNPVIKSRVLYPKNVYTTAKTNKDKEKIIFIKIHPGREAR